MKRFVGITFLISFLVFLSSCIDNIVSSTLYQYGIANNDAKVPEDAPAPMQKIDLTDAQGNRTVGWYYVYSKTAPTVIYFHGNASNLESTYANGFGEKMINLKVNFAIFDYPKYGLSTGEPSEATVVSSAQQVFDFLKERLPNSEFIIWGRSLGCAPATIMAEKNQSRVSKLILTSPWDSFWRMVKYRSNLSDDTCKKAVVGNEYETEKHAEHITMPVLIHHGTKDTTVPWELGKNLSGHFAGNDVTFVSVEGADHNNLLGNAEWDEIAQFIRY